MFDVAIKERWITILVMFEQVIFWKVKIVFSYYNTITWFLGGIDENNAIG